MINFLLKKLFRISSFLKKTTQDFQKMADWVTQEILASPNLLTIDNLDSQWGEQVITPEVAQILIKENNSIVFEWLGYYSPLPEEIINHLITTKENQTLEKILLSKNKLSDEQLIAIFKNSQDTTNSKGAKGLLAEQKKLPLEIQKLILKEVKTERDGWLGNLTFKNYLEHNPYLETPFLINLFNSGSNEYKSQIVREYYITPDFAHWVMGHFDKDLALMREFAQNTRLPEDIQLRLIEFEDEIINNHLVKHFRLSPIAQQKLIEFNNSEINEYLLSHYTAIPLMQLYQILKNQNNPAELKRIILDRLGRSPKITEEDFKEIAQANQQELINLILETEKLPWDRRSYSFKQEIKTYFKDLNNPKIKEYLREQELTDIRQSIVPDQTFEMIFEEALKTHDFEKLEVQLQAIDDYSLFSDYLRKNIHYLELLPSSTRKLLLQEILQPEDYDLFFKPISSSSFERALRYKAIKEYQPKDTEEFVKWLNEHLDHEKYPIKDLMGRRLEELI